MTARRLVGATRLLSALVMAVAGCPGLVDAASRVTFTTSDGIPIVGTYFEPARRPSPAVVLVHMATRTRADWQGVGEQLAARGVAALAIDLRGHGESGGPRADGGSLADGVRDLWAALAWVRAQPDTLPGRVGLAGASLGANLVTLAAADDPAVRAIALLSATLDFRGVRTEAALRKYGDRPALLVCSQEDGYASRSARALATAGTGFRDVRVLEGAGHGTTMLARDPDVASALVDWLCARLL